MVRAISSGSPDDGAQAGEFLDQVDEAAAQQRLAAGEADFLDAQSDEEPDQAEIFVDGKFGILGAVIRRCGSRRTCSCSGR